MLPIFRWIYIRAGNASGFQFHEERALKDCVTYWREGILFVCANMNGFSCFKMITPVMKRLGRNVWKLKKGAILSPELRLVEDRRPGHEGHYMIVPEKDMPLHKYLGLLEELERDPICCVKLTPQEIKNG